jgi:hypothetical protein
MNKPVPSSSNVYRSRLETRITDGSAISELVTDTDPDQCEDGEWSGLAQSLYRWLDDTASIPGRDNVGFLPLRHCTQTGSGSHPASYPMVTGGPFMWSKAAGVWIWPLSI